MSKTSTVTVTVGEKEVVIHRQGVSRPVIAGILGTEADDQGMKTIWLDRRIHYPGEKQFIGWEVKGAVSTVLTRI